jgi:hypothetical protein
MKPAIDFVAWSQSLLEEWQTVKNARPKTDLVSSVDLEYAREIIEEWAILLRRYSFDKTSSSQLADACYQFETRLAKYKKKVIIETLQHGTIH